MTPGTSTSTAHPPASPSSSPRLPSPPPLTEVQFGPKSPGLGGDNVVLPKAVLGDPNHGSKTGTSGQDGSGTENQTTRRIRPGTKAEEMSSGPPLVPLSELDSAFQLQEHLKALYQSHRQPAHLDHTVPITRPTAFQLATPPEGVDRYLWLYELCRLLTNKLNTIIVGLFTDAPPCSAATCAEMRASEWQYLCAVHDPPKPCCAIDYSCHTLDWAANMLTSSKLFPSRLTLDAAPLGGGGGGGGNSNAAAVGGGGGGAGGGQAAQHQQGLRNLTNVCRRLYRIFAHAWYQHRSVFWQVESQTGLYVFFKTVCDVYQLIPEDNYTVPPEAEGLENMRSNASAASNYPLSPPSLSSGLSSSSSSSANVPSQAATILKRPPPPPFSSSDMTETTMTMDASEVARTTRRHMSTLSIGSSASSAGAVTTVPEEEEEEEEEEDDDKKGREATARQEVDDSDKKEVVEEEEIAPESGAEGGEEEQQTQPSQRNEAQGPEEQTPSGVTSPQDELPSEAAPTNPSAEENPSKREEVQEDDEPVDVSPAVAVVVAEEEEEEEEEKAVEQDEQKDEKEEHLKDKEAMKEPALLRVTDDDSARVDDRENNDLAKSTIEAVGMEDDTT
ncbi:MAG: MOB member 4, phocein [Peltula sp. TS41687]|nr:MAG: MOB member 4, phocein [Peltula sp. TS41687]